MMAKHDDLPNRRRHPRTKALNLIKWHTKDNGQAEHEGWIANIRDVSASGIKFCTDEEIPEKGIISITLSLAAENKQIPVLGEIAWKKSMEADGAAYSYVGVSFIELKNEDQDALGRFIHQLNHPTVP